MKRIFGNHQEIGFPEYGIDNILAKFDPANHLQLELAQGFIKV